MSIGDSPPILDGFMPHPDVRERFHTTIKAPASIVLETACGLDMQSLPLVRAIFAMRQFLMRTPTTAPRVPQGMLAETLGLGWGVLHRDDRMVIVGARCQPWRGDVTFTAIAPERFASDDQPEQVKIVWTLEAQALGPAQTRFWHETRVLATDAVARQRFMRYWRWARFGILTIRYMMLPAVRRQAEARWTG